MTLTYGLGILQGQWKRHHSIIRLAIVSSYRQACAKRSHAGIVFTQWSKNGFFAPHWQKCGNTAPKTVKISNLGHKFVPQGRLVCCIFLWNSGRLYASIGSFYLYSLVASVASYKHFSSVRALCHKFLIDPSGETTDWIKKLEGAKVVRTSSITTPSMMIMGRAPAVHEKVWCFCLFFVTLSNYDVCDNGNAMKQWNFQNNGVIA